MGKKIVSSSQSGKKPDEITMIWNVLPSNVQKFTAIL